MIDYIKGFIFESGNGAISVRVGNIGYKVFVTETIKEQLLNKTSEIYIESISGQRGETTLYGFKNQKDKDFFLRLIKVSKIGPKKAIKIMGSAPMEDINTSVESGDIKSLENMGIPKTDARKLILELSSVTKIKRGADEDLVEALLKMGYSKQEINEVISEVKGSSIKNKIESALKLLSIVV